MSGARIDHLLRNLRHVPLYFVDFALVLQRPQIYARLDKCLSQRVKTKNYEICKLPEYSFILNRYNIGDATVAIVVVVLAFIIPATPRFWCFSKLGEGNK